MYESIFIEGLGEQFYMLSNADRKQWLIPMRNMRTALQLYQPSTWKGKLVKAFLPLLKHQPALLRILGIHIKRYALLPELDQTLKTCFATKTLEFSVFFGTPSAQQKPTLQLTSGERILGYCKVSSRDEVIKHFVHERQILDELNHKGMPRIPSILYCEALQSGFWLFVQTTNKTSQSKIIHRWTESHWDFLTELHLHTRTLCAFNNSDLAASLTILENFMEQLPVDEAQIFRKAISRIRTFYGNETFEFSAFHGDFTPWNTYFENKKLFAFDLEYAGLTFPPYLDFFHFNTQIAILEKNYSYIKTFTYNKKLASQTILSHQFNELYLSYLLMVVARFFELNGKPLDMSDRCYSRWYPLICLIINS